MNLQLKATVCVGAALILSMFSVRAAAIAACDGDPIPVSVFANAPAVAETGGGVGQFVFHLEPVTGGTTLTLQIAGTATNGVDYTAISTSIVIPGGQAETPLTLSPLADFATEGSETVTVTIMATNSPCISIGSPNSATIAIADGDALAPDASATTVVVPIVAETASYSTEVYVRNANPVPVTLNVSFYEAKNSSVPGLRSCSAFVLPAFTTHPLTLGTQCALGAGSHFGMLLLDDAAVPKTHKFTVFSRSQTPAGVGFSVEGFPTAKFSSAVASSDGLKRSSTGPKYLSNCFVAALDNPIDYRIDLFTQDGVPIGNAITDSLLPHQIVRYLDVLALAGAPAGDYAGVRAQFSEMGPGTAPLVAFCTMQESVTFSADFRIAKPVSVVPTPMVVPIVARTASYNTEVYVYNPSASALALDVDLYEATTSANPGAHACNPLNVPGHSTRLLTLAEQCALDGNSHFGMLLLETASTSAFAVFSRSQTPAGVGFSVEGRPLTQFKTAPAGIDGLKRSSSAPSYLSNCFVAAPGSALSYSINLSTGDGVPIGSITGSLASHQMVRHLDVLKLAGDVSNVKATITETSPGTSAFIGFCTMQESVTFGADFRIGK